KNVLPPSGGADDGNTGYAPALRALADQLDERFAELCLPQWLFIDSCALVEVRKSDDCSCDPGTGRVAPHDVGATVADKVQFELDLKNSTGDCICQIQALDGDASSACENDTNASTPGYCYLDAELAIGDPSLLAGCPASMQRRIRVIGDDIP